MGKRVQVLFAVLFVVMFVPAFGSTATAAPVTVGHSGWTWGNPTPQGNDIRVLEFAGDRGYAAGNFGTLVRSDDGGATWTGLSTGLTVDLVRLRIIDSDSLVIAGGCAVRRSDDAGQTFARLPWTGSDQSCASGIVSLHFPSNEVGYLVVENGTVLRTSDGGQTWTRKTAVPDTGATGGGAKPTDIFFTGLDTGVATTTTGRIYRTIDGGSSWTLVNTEGGGTPLSGLYFADPNMGYAVGGSGHLFATTDGGATWASIYTNTEFPLTSIRCADAATCIMTLGTGELILRMINGTISAVTPSTQKIFAAAFSSANRAVGAGALGTTVVSNDAGKTWSGIGASGLGDDFVRLRASSSLLAFATGENGALAKTTDGGVSWANVGVSTSSRVRDASFATETVGFALDIGGTLFRTDNGGVSWKILNTGTSTAPRALLALDANRILLIGPRGIRRSTDGGGSFAPVRGRVARANLIDYDRAGSAVFVFDFKSVFVSTTAGQSWKKVKRPPTRADLEAVDFVSAKRGFILTYEGRLWRTTNGGRKWREVPLGSDSGFELAFSDSNNGFVAVRDFAGKFNGYVLRTTDGGKTWQPQLLDDEGIDTDGLVVTGGNSAIALSLSNALFATTTGGQAGSATSLSLRTNSRTLRKKSRITVTGKLSPAEGGEQVVVSMRGAKLKRWRHQVVTVAANGSFTTSWKVKATSYFAAQWAGDDTRAGDGSKLLTVKVR